MNEWLNSIPGLGELIGSARAIAAGAIVAIAAAVFAQWRARRSGREAQELDQRRENDKREEAGREAVEREKRETDGASARDILDRLRRRDGDWRGM